MAVVVVKDKVTKKNIQKASEEYGNYIKVVIDTKTEKVAIGGEWHADGEKELLKLDSKQENIWGGGIDIKSKKIDFSALINLHAGRNESMEILDGETRSKFSTIVKKKFDI